MSLGIDTNRLSADPRALAELKQSAKTDGTAPKTLRAVAQQFESLFAQMLIKSMRATSVGDSMMDSEQSDFYRDMFDQQLSVELTKGRGLGLADMLMRQLAGNAGAADATDATGDADPAALMNPISSKNPTDGNTATTANPSNGANAADSAIPATTGATAIPTASALPDRSAAWPPASRAEFVKALWPHAQAAGRKLGVDPITIVSHAALETGWGRSMPSGPAGQSGYNLFGIKAGRSWEGAATSASTLEFADGAAVRKVERFRSYPSLGEGIEDYAKLLANGQRYSAARNTGNDVAAFAGGLQKGGYATDPAYASKLQAVASQLRTMLGGSTTLKTADARPIHETSWAST